MKKKKAESKQKEKAAATIQPNAGKERQGKRDVNEKKHRDWLESVAFQAPGIVLKALCQNEGSRITIPQSLYLPYQKKPRQGRGRKKGNK